MANPLLQDSLLSGGERLAYQRRSRLQRSIRWLRRIKSYPQLWLGGIVLFILIFTAAFAFAIAPYSPNEVGVGSSFEHPNLSHLFGTDRLGRDLFARMLYGGRVDMAVSLAAVIGGMVLGVGFGLISGYKPGWIDSAIMRTMDGLLAFPGLILALTIGFALGASAQSIIVALAVVRIPAFARLTRGQMLALRHQEFIVAAESMGASSSRIVLRHYLPNLVAVILVEATLGAGATIFAAASLSFLGLGVPPPAPTWGGMLRDGYVYLEQNPWLSLIPGFFIFMAVLSFNFLGDGLRDYLDPQQRKKRV